ncbi:MAG: hypothetical protein F4X98_19245 [Gammaproteobacteria bacterium]|nr:hypothetical protein [Gammaproteobacteria bacterium]
MNTRKLTGALAVLLFVSTADAIMRGGICGIVADNAYLPTFMADFDRSVAVEPRDSLGRALADAPPSGS